jgi:DNA-binding response OmpR family regulator
MSHIDLAILIVEDDQPTRELYQRELSLHYAVFACADEAGALEIIHSHDLCAIVLEPSLPDERGWALLEAIRTMPSTSSIPVIVCSTLDERKRGMQLGATVYLVKPVLPTTLLRTLSQITEL